MNKVFLGIILAVCILGMLLVILNNRLGRKPEPRVNPPVAEATVPAPPASPEEIEANARALEVAEAARALAGEAERGAQERELPSQAAEPPFAAPAREPEVIPPAPPLIQEKEPAQPQVKPAPVPAQTAKPEPKPAVRPEPPLAPETKPAPPAVAEKPARQDTPAGAKTVTRYVIYARDKGATIRIGGASKMDYSSMTLENPDRVVVDLGGIWKFPANPGIPKNELVSAIRVGQSGDKTRVVIDLKAKPRKVILVPFKNGDGVDVRVDR